MAEHLTLFTEVRRPCSKAEAMGGLKNAFSRPRAPSIDCIEAKGPTELHRRMVEQERSHHGLGESLPNVQAQALQEYDPYEEEMEVMRELDVDPQGPEPDENY